MKSRFLPLLLLLLLLPLRARSLELEAGHINPFGENTLTVVTDVPGTLTIHAAGYMDPVTDLAVEAGTTTLTWRALSWHGEPLTPGLTDLTAELTTPEGGLITAVKRVRIRQPLQAVLFCLPEQAAFVIGGEPLRVEVGMTSPGPMRLELAPAAEGPRPCGSGTAPAPTPSTPSPGTGAGPSPRRSRGSMCCGLGPWPAPGRWRRAR